MTARGTEPFGTLPPSRFLRIAVTSLCAFALLAFVVAHDSGPYGFEDPVFTWLGAPSATVTWAHLSQLLATPAIVAALAISAAIGLARRRLPRVLVYAAIAATTFLVSEHIAKPVVQRSYYGELTFPSGSVTAVSATALAMWLALRPLHGRRASLIQAGISCVWTLLTALAVVGALWHTPLDDIGSVLLSVGIVTAGAALFESVASRRHRVGTQRQEARR
jgi:hypothetical protein